MEKKVYTPFPPAQQPRKVDLQIESGEYFLGKRERELKKIQEKRALQEENSELKRQERAKGYVAPEEEQYENKLLSKEKKEKKEKRRKRKRRRRRGNQVMIMTMMMRMSQSI